MLGERSTDAPCQFPPAAAAAAPNPTSQRHSCSRWQRASSRTRQAPTETCSWCRLPRMSSLWCEYLSTEFARKCFILPTRSSGILPGRGSHHVAFLRLPDRGAEAFYDSMSDIQKGQRVSTLFEVPGLAEYFRTVTTNRACRCRKTPARRALQISFCATSSERGVHVSLHQLHQLTPIVSRAIYSSSGVFQQRAVRVDRLFPGFEMKTALVGIMM